VGGVGAQMRPFSAPRASTPSLALLGTWAARLSPSPCWGTGEGPSSSPAVGWLGSKSLFFRALLGCVCSSVLICTAETDLPPFPTLLRFGLCPGAVLESSGSGERQLDSFRMEPNQMCSRNAPRAPQPLVGVQAAASA